MALTLPELAMGFYLYMIGGIAFLMQIFIFEAYRNIRSMRRKAKREARLDPVALRWLRRVEDPEYDPAAYGEEF
jgi:hypothetical protein